MYNCLRSSCPLLLTLRSILARQRAVKELVESDELCLNEAKEALANLPDLERNICSVYNRRVSLQVF